jgi:hypothetical protein
MEYLQMRSVLYCFSPFMGDLTCRSSGAGVHCAALFYKYVAATWLEMASRNLEAKLNGVHPAR